MCNDHPCLFGYWVIEEGVETTNQSLYRVPPYFPRRTSGRPEDKYVFSNYGGGDRVETHERKNLSVKGPVLRG